MASLTTTKCDKAFEIKRWLVLSLPHISITPFVIMIRVVPLAPMNAALNYFPISVDMFRAAALQLFQLPFMVAVVTGVYSIILPINFGTCLGAFWRSLSFSELRRKETQKWDLQQSCCHGENVSKAKAGQCIARLLGNYRQSNSGSDFFNMYFKPSIAIKNCLDRYKNSCLET